jgi:HPt (histidine-containing phosphotransfer) domain-containing protein
LRGYFFMEGNEQTGPLVHHDDALLFIIDTVSYILSKKETGQDPSGSAYASVPQSAADPMPPVLESLPEQLVELRSTSLTSRLAPAKSVSEAARTVKGLDVDRGLLLIGGMEEQYGELLRISAKVFADGIQKMRTQYTADLPGFAIEVHGMKGALYNIGADGLGDLAKQLEFAAKAGDGTACLEFYPAFEEKLAEFARDLDSITLLDAGPAGAGSLTDLAEALERALDACRKFDAILAGKVMAPFSRLSWGIMEPVRDAVQAITESLENIDYDQAETLLTGLLNKIREPNRSQGPGGGADGGT